MLPAAQNHGVGPGAGAPPPTVFQVALPFAMISTTAKITEAFADPALNNCANLTLVFLGLSKEPKRYLEICRQYAERTQQDTLTDYINDGIRQVLPGGPPAVLQEYAVDLHTPFGMRMAQIGNSLQSGHGTLVGFAFADGTKHIAAVYETWFGHRVYLVDFQLRNPDQSYPAIHEISADGTTPSPYGSPVVSIFVTHGPIISSLASVKQMGLHIYQTHFMNVNTGGKRRHKSRRSKISKRKTRKGRSR